MSQDFNSESLQQMRDKQWIMSGLNPREHKDKEELERNKWNHILDEITAEEVETFLDNSENDLEVSRINRKDPYEDIGYTFHIQFGYDGFQCLFLGEYSQDSIIEIHPPEHPNLTVERNYEPQDKYDLKNYLTSEFDGLKTQ